VRQIGFCDFSRSIGSGAQFFYPSSIDVKADDLQTGACEGHSDRKADIAEPDDGNIALLWQMKPLAPLNSNSGEPLLSRPPRASQLRENARD
jgi:hypothetical protein